MKVKLRNFILALLFLATTGCAQHHWMSPEITGTVIDAATKKPIGAVEVVRIPNNGETVRVDTTTADGTFHVDASGGVVFSLPIGDPGYIGYFLFKKEGYVEAQLDYGVITGEVVNKKPPHISNALVELKKK